MKSAQFQPPAPSDPVFAAIAHWRPIWAAYMAACAIEDAEACEAAVATTHIPAYAALRDVYTTQPTTPAGLLAIMTVMLEADGDHLNLSSPENLSGLDDGERGLIAVFHYAKRMLEQNLECAAFCPQPNA